MLTTFIVVYIIVSLIAIISIILYGSNPSKSLGWMLIIIMFPIGGVFLYILFGVNRREFKIFTLKRTLERRLYDRNYFKNDTSEKKSIFTSDKKRKLATLIGNSSKFPPYKGNKVTVLNNGSMAYKMMFEKMKAAKNFIHIQFYIFEEGEVLDEFYAIFKQKVSEGVEIRIMYDAVGSMSWTNKSIKRFKDLGIEIYPILSMKFGSILFTLNFRNHRKIIVIDGEIGLTGGVNISDKYIKSQSRLGIWDDEHVCIEGPAVQSLHQIFIKDYYFASNKENLLEDKYHPRISEKGDSIVQIVASGPDSKHSSIMQQYLALIFLADKCIYIANPYFIPTRAVLEAIKISALSGVKIKLLIPKISDSQLAKYSMYSHFKELLNVGIEIYRSSNFLHSKIILVDDEIASVGSGNFDHRSFEQNFETNALIYDEEITKEICNNYLEDCEKGTILTLEEHNARPIYSKLLEGLARLFSPLL
jgi:cardiolipin synthase